MNENILIIGGSGCIGQKIQYYLKSRHTNVSIYIGSRQQRNDNEKYIQVDVNDEKSIHQITSHKINLIVLCTSDKTNSVLKHCIAAGIDYLDISKATEELEKAYILTQQVPINSRIVFSSGWMGGIIPALVDWATVGSNDIEEILTFIYYSLNDASGKTSADFMAENIVKPFKIFRNNKIVWRKYYTRPTKHNFGFNKGKRKAFLFDTPDTFILRQSIKVPTIITRTTYNSTLTNGLLYLFQLLGIFNIFSLQQRKSIFESKGKGDQTAFDVILKNKKKAIKISLQNMTGQADLTAFATVLHIEQLCKATIKKGTYFSHQIHNSSLFVGQLSSLPSIKITKNNI